MGTMFSARLGVAAFGGTSAAAVLVFSSQYNTASADKAPASAAVRAAAMGKLPELTLYQYDPCPFCCKVKAFLDANDVPYKCVEVDPVWKKQLAFSVGYQKVPVLMVGDEQVNDSDNIIDTLTDRLKLKEGGDTTATPPTTAATDLITIDPSSGEEGERKWRNWVNNSLVHLLTVNIYGSVSESYQAFEYISQAGAFTDTERMLTKHVGALSMRGVSMLIARKHQIQKPREELLAAAKEWVDTAVGDKEFHGGGKADLADLAVFGVVKAIEGLETWSYVMVHADGMSPWYRRMQREVGDSSRIILDPALDNLQA